MRRIVSLVLALTSLAGCQSLSTVRTETPRLSTVDPLRFDRAVVVVYTGEGGQTRSVHAEDVVVRGDSTFWRETTAAARWLRARPEAVPTRSVREVVALRRTPKVGRGAGNGSKLGLALGAVAAAVVSRDNGGCPECVGPLGPVLGLLAGTTTLLASTLVGAIAGSAAHGVTRHTLNATPPPP